MDYKKNLVCNLSGDKNLIKILSLGLIPPVNQMNKINKPLKSQVYYPTELFYSKKSHLVQLGIILKKEILFPKEYPYTSSTTKILRDNFIDLAEEVCSNFNLSKDDLIIDIGSNDGNLLSNFKDKTKILGITPENIAKIAIDKGIPTIQKYFSKSLSNQIIKKYGRAKIVTATNVFAHIDNIKEIFSAVVNLLKDDGIFICECHYLYDLVKDIQYDTIYHEHMRYYSLSSLQYLFNLFGWQIIKAKKINTHGGSIRVYASKKNAYKVDKKYFELINLEKVNLFKKDIYKLESKVLKTKFDLYELLREIKLNKRKIFGISAPSRASTLVNFLGLNSSILDYILEIKGSKKIGYYLPGTDIPIMDEKILYLKQPEYALILSWHISKEIIYNLRKKGFKGSFIIPLPKPKIVN